MRVLEVSRGPGQHLGVRVNHPRTLLQIRLAPYLVNGNCFLVMFSFAKCEGWSSPSFSRPAAL